MYFLVVCMPDKLNWPRDNSDDFSFGKEFPGVLDLHTED